MLPKFETPSANNGRFKQPAKNENIDKFLHLVSIFSGDDVITRGREKSVSWIKYYAMEFTHLLVNSQR